MLMKSRINAQNDLHRRNLTRLIFQEEVPVEMPHIMGLPLSALNQEEVSESRKTTSQPFPLPPPPPPANACKAPYQCLRPEQSVCDSLYVCTVCSRHVR